MSRGRVYRFKDMSVEQVNAYLNKQEIPVGLEAKTYEFLGGRIEHLQMFVLKIKDGLTFDRTFLLILEAKQSLLNSIGLPLIPKWNDVDDETCRKIIDFAKPRESFEYSELRSQLNAANLGKSVDSLVNMKVLAETDIQTYTFHSKAIKEYLKQNMKNF